MNLQRFQQLLDTAARHKAQPSDAVRVVINGTAAAVVGIEWNAELHRLEIRASR